MFRPEYSERVTLRGEQLEALCTDKTARLYAGSLVAELQLLSSCHAAQGLDCVHAVSEPVVTETRDGLELRLDSGSSVWDGKSYHLICSPDRMEYYYTVKGHGDITDCEFFQASISNATEEGERSSERKLSVPFFSEYFNPEPNAWRKHYFAFDEFSTIGVRSDKTYYRGNWLFTPGPFCFAIRLTNGKWLAMGVAARSGENNFVDYQYQGGDGFGLRLLYEGQTRVDGLWESPRIVLMVADDEWTALGKYCGFLRSQGYTPAGRQQVFPWWREPIFCGWGQQSCLSHAAGRPQDVQRYATQSNYETFVRQLAERGLNPGTIIIDDKWQETYGGNMPDRDKWPDLAGFIASQHQAQRRVLLWLKAWDPEGLPASECLLDAEGRPVGVDPTSAGYESRLRHTVRTLIRDYGADGFKLDFTAKLPTDVVGRRSGEPWGTELLHRLIAIIHSEAKANKEDALIIAHTANPYFADVVDMLRLNDVVILPGLPETDNYAESMVRRQKVARAASPDWLIDADNWPSPTLEAWWEYVRRQPEIGVPSLYYITHIDESGEAITERHCREMAELWDRYRKFSS